MSIKYAWRCKFCDSANAAGSSTCAACAQPATARPVDVEGAGYIEPPKPTVQISSPILHAVFVVLVVVGLFLYALERFAVGLRAKFSYLAVIAVVGGLAWIIWKFAARPVPDLPQDENEQIVRPRKR